MLVRAQLGSFAHLAFPRGQRPGPSFGVHLTWQPVSRGNSSHCPQESSFSWTQGHSRDGPEGASGVEAVGGTEAGGGGDDEGCGGVVDGGGGGMVDGGRGDLLDGRRCLGTWWVGGACSVARDDDTACVIGFNSSSSGPMTAKLINAPPVSSSVARVQRHSRIWRVPFV